MAKRAPTNQGVQEPVRGGPDLAAGLSAAARAPVLLVASDYDGTLAPIVDDPEQAHPHREALVAMAALAAMPDTHAAVISGRALSTLAELTGGPPHVHLVGSHGSEFDVGFAHRLPAAARQRKERLVKALRRLAATNAGFRLEEKPAGVAFHYRLAAPAAAREAVSAILAGPATWSGIHVRAGKKVLELSVVGTDKGRALEILRHRVGAGTTVFLGDDLTDESGFATLAGPDIGVKVGPGRTRARHRVADPAAVARLLAGLAEERAGWLAGQAAVPIEQHSLLSDQRTAALVTPYGRITWACLPRLDSPAVLAELLGGPTAGYFAVRPLSTTDPGRPEWVGDSMVLATRWPGLTVTDYLDCSHGRPRRRAGRTDLVRVLEGSETALVEFAPRPDFGRLPARLIVDEDGIEVEGGVDPLVLRAPGVRWTLRREGGAETAVAEVDLAAGPVVLELRHGTASRRPDSLAEADRRRQTIATWQTWSDGLTLPPVATDLVRRSALVLKALCHGPTGAIAAAATTSLPEHVGGVRNWDYRFCWPRDAAMSARSLVRLGSVQEGMELLDWLLGVVDRCEAPERLRPLYDVAGFDPGPEATISELAGWAGSRPVRVGNAAAHQVQRDVFGPIVDLAAALAERGAPLSAEHFRLVDSMVSAVRRGWQQPDHGIWEARLPRRHHVHSKVMAWVTLDRALAIADHGLGREAPDWRSLRGAIAEDVLARGWNDGLQAFGGAYGEGWLDAAALHVGLSGLLPSDDPRFAATVKAVETGLRDGPTVHRYRHDDGLPGMAGGFHVCTAWLVQALARVGRRDDAWELFEGLCALAGPTGLLSEVYGPRSRRALGNHPQAYSHLGLIDCAVLLAELDSGSVGPG